VRLVTGDLDLLILYKIIGILLIVIVGHTFIYSGYKS
jgi:hypothetical protein